MSPRQPQNIVGVGRILDHLRKHADTPDALPKHPGYYLRAELTALSISQGDFAKHIGESYKTINKVMNGREQVGLILALRLARALNTTPDYWLNLQIEYDLSVVDALMVVVDHIPPLVTE